MPDCFFTFTETYNPTGDPTPVELPVLDTLKDSSRTDAAVSDLLTRKLLLTCDMDGTLAVHPEAASQLSEKTIDRRIWQAAALDCVCRSFPRWWVPSAR